MQCKNIICYLGNFSTEAMSLGIRSAAEHPGLLFTLSESLRELTWECNESDLETCKEYFQPSLTALAWSCDWAPIGESSLHQLSALTGLKRLNLGNLLLESLAILHWAAHLQRQVVEVVKACVNSN